MDPVFADPKNRVLDLVLKAKWGTQFFLPLIMLILLHIITVNRTNETYEMEVQVPIK